MIINDRVVEADDILPAPPEEDIDVSTTSTLPPEEIERLVKDNIGLAISIARTWAANHQEADADDIYAIARAGLVHAANQYDPRKGAFAAYAGRAIRNHLGYNKYRSGRHNAANLTVLDAPIGGEDGDDTTTMADRTASSASAADSDLEHGEAQQVVLDEINALPSPVREMVMRWMNGESYRDMQKDFNVSFVQIGNLVRDALNKIKANLVKKNIVSLDDIWGESLVASDSGRMVKALLIEHVRFSKASA